MVSNVAQLLLRTSVIRLNAENSSNERLGRQFDEPQWTAIAITLECAGTSIRLSAKAQRKGKQHCTQGSKVNGDGG